MPALRDLQEKFISDILDGGKSALAHIHDDGSIPAERRMQVYRNNAFFILSDRLLDTFPSTAEIGGEDFFRALAHAFIRAHPPREGDINTYGAELPGFMLSESALAPYPFLADIAALEWLRQESYMAADEGTGPLAPCLRLLSSPWPVIRLWQLGMKQIKVGDVDIHGGGENAVIFRSGDGIEMWSVTEDIFDFISGLATGGDIGIPEGFDAPGCLRRLKEAGLIQQKGPTP